MPCYCSMPEETDQEEIERRAKERMYFDSVNILTREQAQECEKRGLKQFPMLGINDHLCKICKVLTDEQMKNISAYYFDIKWPHESLYDWHIQHCKDDIAMQKE